MKIFHEMRILFRIRPSLSLWVVRKSKPVLIGQAITATNKTGGPRNFFANGGLAYQCDQGNQSEKCEGLGI